jgi:replicative DNA helicase
MLEPGERRQISDMELWLAVILAEQRMASIQSRSQTDARPTLVDLFQSGALHTGMIDSLLRRDSIIDIVRSDLMALRRIAADVERNRGKFGIYINPDDTGKGKYCAAKVEIGKGQTLCTYGSTPFSRKDGTTVQDLNQMYYRRPGGTDEMISGVPNAHFGIAVGCFFNSSWHQGYNTNVTMEYRVILGQTLPLLVTTEVVHAGQELFVKYPYKDHVNFTLEDIRLTGDGDGMKGMCSPGAMKRLFTSDWQKRTPNAASMFGLPKLEMFHGAIAAGIIQGDQVNAEEATVPLTPCQWYNKSDEEAAALLCNSKLEERMPNDHYVLSAMELAKRIISGDNAMMFDNGLPSCFMPVSTVMNFGPGGVLTSNPNNIMVVDPGASYCLISADDRIAKKVKGLSLKQTAPGTITLHAPGGVIPPSGNFAVTWPVVYVFLEALVALMESKRLDNDDGVELLHEVLNYTRKGVRRMDAKVIIDKTRKIKALDSVVEALKNAKPPFKAIDFRILLKVVKVQCEEFRYFRKSFFCFF